VELVPTVVPAPAWRGADVCRFYGVLVSSNLRTWFRYSVIFKSDPTTLKMELMSKEFQTTVPVSDGLAALQVQFVQLGVEALTHVLTPWK
jgi:hypothetical protein